MKRIYLLSLFSISLFLGACGIISKDDPCGPSKDDFQRFNNGGTLFGIDMPSNTYVQDGDRVFQWTTPLYENVCPKEHVNILATFQLEPNPMLPLKTRIIGAYAFFFESNIPMTETSIDGTSEFRDFEGNFGIKHAFDPDPGWFNAYAEIAFPTTGVYAQDSNYLMSVWKNIDVSTFYKDYKK